MSRAGLFAPVEGLVREGGLFYMIDFDILRPYSRLYVNAVCPAVDLDVRRRVYWQVEQPLYGLIGRNTVVSGVRAALEGLAAGGGEDGV